MKVYAAVPAHTRWLWPLCKGQYQVKSTCKFIFIFPHYLPAYQSEAIKVVAGGFQPRMISKPDFRMATAYFEAKKKANHPLWTIQYYLTIHIYCICKLSLYMVTFNSDKVVFCCNCMTNSCGLMFWLPFTVLSPTHCRYWHRTVSEWDHV